MVKPKKESHKKQEKTERIRWMIFREKVKELEKVRDEYLDGWKRAISSQKNERKALEELSMRMSKSGVIKLLKDFIMVIDSLDAALKSDHLSENEKEGITRIYDQFYSIFEKNGVKEISPKKEEKFDPIFHEAIGTVNVDDDKKDGDIVEVVSKGYMLDEEIIRPSRVVISIFSNQN